MNKNETNLSIRKIAQKVGKSASTVCRVLQRIKEKRTVQKVLNVEEWEGQGKSPRNKADG